MNENSVDIDGSEVSHVAFVARVMEHESRSTVVTFVADDGTATIDVKKWIDSNDPENAELLDLLESKPYVRVVGSIKKYQNKRSVQCHSIQPITSPDMISHHILQTLYVHLHLTRGAPMSSAAMAQQQNYQGEYAKPQGSNTMMQVDSSLAQDDCAHLRGTLPRLEIDIYRYVKKCSASNTDAYVPDIIHHFRSTASEIQVRDAIERLSSEALVYSTADDDHIVTTST